MVDLSKIKIKRIIYSHVGHRIWTCNAYTYALHTACLARGGEFIITVPDEIYYALRGIIRKSDWFAIIITIIISLTIGTRISDNREKHATITHSTVHLSMPISVYLKIAHRTIVRRVRIFSTRPDLHRPQSSRMTYIIYRSFGTRVMLEHRTIIIIDINRTVYCAINICVLLLTTWTTSIGSRNSATIVEMLLMAKK